jgi:hypothetical protein
MVGGACSGRVCRRIASAPSARTRRASTAANRGEGFDGVSGIVAAPGTLIGANGRSECICFTRIHQTKPNLGRMGKMGRSVDLPEGSRPTNPTRGEADAQAPAPNEATCQSGMQCMTISQPCAGAKRSQWTFAKSVDARRGGADGRTHRAFGRSSANGMKLRRLQRVRSGRDRTHASDSREREIAGVGYVSTAGCRPRLLCRVQRTLMDERCSVPRGRDRGGGSLICGATARPPLTLSSPLSTIRLRSSQQGRGFHASAWRINCPPLSVRRISRPLK